MKIRKILVLGLAALTINSLALPVFATTQETTLTTSYDESFTHTLWTGDNTWLNARTQVLNWSNSFNGETSTTFKIYEPNVDVRYYIANTGRETFTWKILDPSGKRWNSGTLAPGKSVTYTALYDLDDIPKGRYTLTIVTANGGAGSAEASVRTID